MVRLRLPDPVDRSSRYLAAREEVLGTYRRDGWAGVLLVGVATAVVVTVGMVYAGPYLDGRAGISYGLVYWALAAGLISASWLGRTDRVVLSPFRVMVVTEGILRKRFRHLGLEAVGDVRLEKSWLGALLGFQTIAFRVDGRRRPLLRIRRVREADRLYADIADLYQNTRLAERARA